MRPRSRVSLAMGNGGTFATLVNTNLPNGFSTSLSYDATHAFLNLTLNLVPPPPTNGADALKTLAPTQ